MISFTIIIIPVMFYFRAHYMSQMCRTKREGEEQNRGSDREESGGRKESDRLRTRSKCVCVGRVGIWVQMCVRSCLLANQTVC